MEPQLAALLNQGNFRFEYRYFVLRDATLPPALAAECAADQGKFWEYHMTLLENQNGGFPTDKLKKLAADQKLDTAAFNACLDSGKYKDKVLQMTEAAAKQGIDGTPAFVMNGVRLKPQRSWLDVTDAVRKALSGK